MDISVIIPTHNRSQSLTRAIDSILQDNIKSEYEIVVVDNNSKDDTKLVISNYKSNVNYYFEPNTSFSKARHTGAKNAKGDILLYIDDDVIISQGSIDKIVEIFVKFSECGVIAARILPKYEEEPPDWCLSCEQAFNGWSLYNPNIYRHLSQGFQEVDWAAGPMMGIRKNVYNLVAGFPPDTLGVETNDSEGTFNKLYVGPGDYGLCTNVIKEGFKVYYVPEVSCYHVIPPIRFTVSFWISRMKGEAHQKAIVNREFYRYSKVQLVFERIKAIINLTKIQIKLISRIKKQNMYSNKFSGLYTEELFFYYWIDYIKIDRILNNYGWLSKYLWDLGQDGVPDKDFISVNKKLPPQYISLYSRENMYPIKSIKSVDDLKKHIKYYYFMNILYKYIIPIIKKDI